MSVTEIKVLEWTCNRCLGTTQTHVETAPVGWVGFVRDDRSQVDLCPECRTELRSAAELMQSVARNLGIPVILAVEGIARPRP